MVIVSPVRGLRPVDALRLLTAKVPKPPRRTSPPFFSEPVIASKTASTALLASPLVRPLESATAAFRSCLFMPKEPLHYGLLILMARSHDESLTMFALVLSTQKRVTIVPKRRSC